MGLSPIHPFPARMAPEIARYTLDEAPATSRVLDPMCGSGTVLRAAVDRNLPCVGVDIDPLAVLMSTVWTSPLEAYRLVHDAHELVDRAQELKDTSVKELPDTETDDFVAYWYAEPQRAQLARLATVLARCRKKTVDALALSLSRTIITKEMSASLARDTSHSRPHRVALTNDFDVYKGFVGAARLIGQRMAAKANGMPADVHHGDARNLHWLADESFDLAITSPPYLNAIDYLRGHRLALVWLGYDVATIRDLRSASVGAERGYDDGAIAVDEFITEPEGTSLAPKHRGWFRRYANDMRAALAEVQRVLKRDGQAVLIVGNSLLRGCVIDNAGIVEKVADDLGMSTQSKVSREIPARRRYLPPPSDSGGSLDSRMRTEAVLTLQKA